MTVIAFPASRAAAASDACVADLYEAFARKFGPDMAVWPEDARRVYLRNATAVHDYYHLQEAAA